MLVYQRVTPLRFIKWMSVSDQWLDESECVRFNMMSNDTNNVQLEKNRGAGLVYHLSFITTDLLHVKGLTR